MCKRKRIEDIYATVVLDVFLALTFLVLTFLALTFFVAEDPRPGAFFTATFFVLLRDAPFLRGALALGDLRADFFFVFVC